HTVMPASIQETEPNNTTGTATALPIGTPGTGDLATPGDVDVWSFAATAGQIVQIEVFGARRDFAAWHAGNNVARIRVLGPDGTTYLIGHPDLSIWFWGTHDLDIPAYKVATTGTHYIELTQHTPARAGGRYVVRVTTRDFGSLQSESEPNDTYTN